MKRKQQKTNELSQGGCRVLTFPNVYPGSSSGNNGSNTRLPTSAPRSIPTTPSAATTTPFNTPAPSAGASAGPGPITHEMFSTALQNALAASASRVRDGEVERGSRRHSREGVGIFCEIVCSVKGWVGSVWCLFCLFVACLFQCVCEWWVCVMTSYYDVIIIGMLEGIFFLG